MNERTSDLHIKHRPKTFADIFGNTAIKESLKVLMQSKESFPHVILLSGPSGCGKTTIGRIIKTFLGCSNIDFKEFNSADVTGVDVSREINKNCMIRPMMSSCKVYLLDECHKISTAAQSALLKTLEDTPEFVYFILCTTDPNKLIKTVRNRCKEFIVNPLDFRETKNLLNSIYKKEGLDPYPNVVNKIARICEGSPRKALVLLGQIIDIAEEEQALKAIDNVTIEETKVIELCKRLISNQPNKWNDVKKMLKNLNEDPEKVRYAILGYLSKVMLNNGNIQIAQIMTMFFDSYMYNGKPALIYSCYMACSIK